MSKIAIEYTSPVDLIPELHDHYKDVGIIKVLDSLSWGGPLVLRGPKGSGKTLALDQWCALNGVPRVALDCSEDTGSVDFIGSYSLRGNETVFTLGALTTAIEVANDVGMCVIVLEEINALTAQSQKMLNPMGDYRRSIHAPKIGKVFNLAGDAKLWVVATMNPKSGNYAGIYSLNQDMKSRWTVADVPYMSARHELALIHDTISLSGAKLPKLIAERLLTLAAESRPGSDSDTPLGKYALSTRDLVICIDNIKRVGVDTGLLLLLNKFDHDFRANAIMRIKDIFNVDLTKVRLFDHI